MEELELLTTTREVLGKKVRFLRRQGITPVHIFGHGIESMALQCDTALLKHVLAQAGQTRLISLKLDKGKEPRKVVTREIQREPRSGELLHVDFYQVRMEEKIRVDVPIIPVGEAPALKIKENFIMQELDNLTVECFPDEIPTSVELDVSSLTEAGQMIHVKDIALDDKITVLNNPEQPVIRISARAVEELIEEEIIAPEEVPLPEEEPNEESSPAS